MGGGGDVLKGEGRGGIRRGRRGRGREGENKRRRRQGRQRRRVQPLLDYLPHIGACRSHFTYNPEWEREGMHETCQDSASNDRPAGACWLSVFPRRHHVMQHGSRCPPRHSVRHRLHSLRMIHRATSHQFHQPLQAIIDIPSHSYRQCMSGEIRPRGARTEAWLKVLQKSAGV
jgi:hypothetical protein